MHNFSFKFKKNMDSFLDQFSIPGWFIYSILGVGFITYYYCEVVKSPTLTCSSPEYKSFLENKVPVVKEKFWPTIWCFESRLQTVLGSAYRGFPHISYSRDILNLYDGGQVGLDWLHPNNGTDSTPVIIILPGFTGCSSSPYIRGFSLVGVEAGFRIVVFNNRGLGGLSLKTPLTFCATKSHDLIEVVHHVKNKYPNAPIGGMGISFGGVILGNYLYRETSGERLFCAVMLVSIPFNVNKASDYTEQIGLNLLLNKHLASCLKDFVKNLKETLDVEDKPWKVDEIMKSKTIKEFDSKFTIKQFGYETVEEYYEDATLHNKILNIRTPLLCLNAADDPFQPLNIYTLADSKNFGNNNIGILITARGGHIGFLEGLWPFKNRNEYMHRVFTQFFSAMFEENMYKHFHV